MELDQVSLPVKARSRRWHLRGVRGLTSLLAAILLLPSCSDDIQKPKETNSRIAASPDELIELLATAYREQDCDLLKSLFVHEPGAQAEFLFVVAPGNYGPDEWWGYDEEVRLHRRMFTPWEDYPIEVPPAIWIASLHIALTRETDWSEREDLYVSPLNPNGLSRQRWKAVDAIYGTDVLWDLQGNTDFAVDGRAHFVVVEDLDKPLGMEGKYLILRWDDLHGGSAALSAGDEVPWSRVKTLYR